MYEVLPVVERDIEDALIHTARTFGLRKLDEYVALIEEALRALDDDSEAGKRRPDVHPEAWTIHIAKRGRNARHLFLYRLRPDGVAVIYGFFHDTMNLSLRFRQRAR